MPEDRERYRHAGMDDCAAKHLRPLELECTLRKSLNEGLDLGSESSPLKIESADSNNLVTDDAGIFDLDDLLQRLMGDKDLARFIAEAFLSDAVKQIESLRVSIESREDSEIRRIAHSIKGAAANIGAPALQKAAHEMEMTVGVGDRETMLRLFPEIKDRYAELAAALKSRLNIP